MIDGEGSIGIATSSRKRRDGSTTESFQLRVRILNTNRVILETATEAAGTGSINARNPWSGARSHHKRLYEWRVSNHLAAKLISDIRPFLVTKQDQTDLALSAQETR